MTKPRRYGGKSHPGTPTQEQTRPITTETSNLVEKSTLFVIFPAKTSLAKKKVARNANSGANETNIDGN